jgi:flagellar hook-associated protein 2
MTMSVDGMVSGMDTTGIITQLLQAEANPQVLLKQKLSAAQTEASAYRTVNTTFAAVRAAAEALTATSLSAARKVSSSLPSVTASAAATAVDGSSLTFTVTGLAAKQTVISNGEWSSLTADARTAKDGSTAEPAWPLEIRNADGTVRGTVTLAPGATLAQAVTAINDKKLGVQASAVRVADGTYRLQITGTATGAANAFELRSDTETDLDGNVGTAFTRTATAQDAGIDLGGGVVATSSSNTFTDLLAGVAVTVSQEAADSGKPVSVTVAQDADGVASKMQALVDAVNAALNTVKTYTNNDKGSTAALKGDYNLTSLSGKLLQAVADAVGADGSPVKVGLQLAKDGKTVVFDKAKFTTALKENPELATRMVSGRVAASGIDGVAGTGDDVTALTGIAGRLFDVAKAASDATTGSIVSLAKGKDSIATDLKNRIEAWDLRLAKRKEMLTRQFTAMETALSSLKNQSTWLAGQINGLPQWS